MIFHAFNGVSYQSQTSPYSFDVGFLMKDFIQPSTFSNIVNNTYCYPNTIQATSSTYGPVNGTITFINVNGSTIGNFWNVSYVTETTINPFSVTNVTKRITMSNGCATSVDLQLYMPTMPFQMQYTTIVDPAMKTFTLTPSTYWKSLSAC